MKRSTQRSTEGSQYSVPSHRESIVEDAAPGVSQSLKALPRSGSAVRVSSASRAGSGTRAMSASRRMPEVA